jgi:hypothetical protein
VEPFVKGLVVGVELDGQWPRRTRARAGLFCGDRMVSVSGDRVGRLICYT